MSNCSLFALYRGFHYGFESISSRCQVVQALHPQHADGSPHPPHVAVQTEAGQGLVAVRRQERVRGGLRAHRKNINPLKPL